MLTRVIDLSLRHRWVVLAASAALVVIGVLAFRSLPIDAFPDTTPVQVQVNTVAPDLTPIEVERQLTIPVEQSLAGLPGVEELRSISKFGLSQITLRFKDGTDLWFARQLAAERIGRVVVPPGADRPALGPVATGLGEIFHYLVKSKSKTLEEIRTLHDWVIAPQLRSVPGVAEINAWGGDEKQWHVIVDPRRLQKFDLTLSDIALALESNNANVGGGVVERGGRARLVLGVGILGSGDGVRDVVVAARRGVPIRIRDVATVEIGRETRRGATTADGEGEAVLGLGFMLVGENSHTVTKALAERLESLKKQLPADVTVEPVYERTWLVDHVLHTVRTNLFEGALLVIAVLFAFLGNLRAGLIVACAIPLSMLFAFSGMLRFGIAGTLMSLGAIDFGLIVDSSVILVENAERRLAEARGRRSHLEVVRDAVVEVRRPTLFGELIIMVVYLPVLTLEGVEGKLFRPMAVTVIFALIGSAILSMTLMPVLASLFLGGRRGEHVREEPRLVRGLKRRYAPVLAWALVHRNWVLVGAAAVVLGAALGATRLGSEFVPRLSEGTIVINTVRLAEVALSESVRYGSRIESVLLAKFPNEIDRVWTRSGTAEVATDPMGVELSDVFITLKPRKEWRRAKTQDQLVAEMSAELEGLPGMRMTFLQPIEMRVNEMIAGVRSDVGVKIFGDDLDVLKATAREVETAVRGIKGAADVTVEQVTGQPVLEVRVDQRASARYGIPARDVLDVVAAMGNLKVGEIQEGERRFDLAIRLSDEYRDDPARLATVPVTAPTGERIPLGRLATIREVSGPTTIQREWGKRRLVVQTNVRGRDLGSFVAELRRVVDRVELPSGYYYRLGGQFENLERAQRRLLVVVPASLILILALLYVTYGRVLDSLRIFVGVPFAMVGGVAALLIRDLPFSISAAVGFIALSGVSVLGDMVLVSRIRQLLDEGVALNEAVTEAAVSRLRPVLMTASVAAIGFVPMALNTGVGAEVQRPLATVVIGGVISSTLLTLVVLPVLYVAFARKRSTVTDGARSRLAGRGPRSETPVRTRDAMRVGQGALALAILWAGSFGAPRTASAVTMEDAIRRALELSPSIVGAGAELAAARAAFSEASLLLPENPEFEVGLGNRNLNEKDFREFEVRVSQAVEITGSRGARKRAAEAALAAAEARLIQQRALVASEARITFGQVLAARQLEELHAEGITIASQAHAAVEERFAAGDASRIELNASRVDVGRGMRSRSAAERDRLAAEAELRSLLGMSQSEPLVCEGELPSGTDRDTSNTERLAQEAVERRPDLVAARLELESVLSEQRLAGRSALPPPRLGAGYREEEEATILEGFVSWELPVFHRNQAGQGAASAGVTRAESAVSSLERRVVIEVERAMTRLRVASEALSSFSGGDVDALTENVALTSEGYQAGQIEYFQLYLARRDLLEVRADQIRALEELNHAEAEMDLALGIVTGVPEE